MSLLVLTASAVDQIAEALTSEELERLMATIFHRLSSGKGFTSPHRSSVTMEQHTTLFMPSRVADIGTAVKVVSVPAASDSRGLPASTLVLDEATGGVKAIVNARSLTALRTAAGSVLATRLLTTNEPITLLAFGAGKQIEAHVNMHLRGFPSIKSCTIVNRSINDRLKKLVASLCERYPNIVFNYTSASSSDHLAMGDTTLPDLVKCAQIICTATSSTKPLFRSEWVTPGTHINLVGSFKPTMIEVDDELINRAGKIAVDSREACAIEAGELIHAGLRKEQMVELGDLVSEDLSPLTSICAEVRAAGDVTIFKSVGVGLQDVAIADLVVSRANDMGIGVRVEDYD
ncbi:NAD-binding protein [Leucogyrophana mollusca]|uniref:NAD-binding protein n=1 Tax=Leucogyrophana mollusca TaxID=85980 RepID=A0ACB8B9K5_9AGAM|nr:NAD-binding protein [Leucogyrophana mollusca]